MNGAVEVDRELRIEIEEEISKLIPPKLCECQNLAEAGDLAVQYLKCEKEYNHEERLACLRVLRMIGSNNALETSKSYFQHVMEEDELREIGMLYCQFTMTELTRNELPNFIKEYIIKYCEESVVVHCEMARVMSFLNKCKRLGIVLLNNDSELILEEFVYLPNLRELKIGAEFVLEFDYEALPENVEMLTLAVPNDQIAYALKVREFLFPVEVKVEIENLEKLTADLLHEEYY